MAVALKKQRKLTNREKEHGIEPIIAEDKKQPIWKGQYKDFLSGELRPLTDSFLKRIGSELIEWAKNNSDALRICAFFDDRGIAQSTCHVWIDTYPDFKECFLVAKRYIGRRRDTGGLTRKYDSGMVRSSLHLFLEEEKQNIIWQSKLKNEEQKENEGTKYIVLEKVPETTIVKARKDNGDV